MKYLFLSVLLFWLMTVQWSTLMAQNNKPAIQSITTQVYKAKEEAQQVIRGKKATIRDHYLVTYQNGTTFFNQAGQITSQMNNGRSISYNYDKEGQATDIMHIGYKKDTSIVKYNYDEQGTLTSSVNTGKPTLETSLNRYTDYTYKIIYEDKDQMNQEEFIQSIPFNIQGRARFYNANHQLMAEVSPHLTRLSNPFIVKYDSILTVVTNEYDDQNRKVLSKRQLITKQHNGKIRKGVVSTSEWTYDPSGKPASSAYFSNQKLYAKYTYTYNDKEDLVLLQAWLGRNKSAQHEIHLQYTYDKFDNWIKCIHFDKNGKPEYWIERRIDYWN